MGVYYFTAVAYWLRDPAKRHQNYIRALEAEGVTVIKGKFKLKDRKCPVCNSDYKGHEEKHTDVNIGLYALRGAYRDEYDVLCLVSADSDLVPAVKMVKKDCPDKKVGMVSPPFLISKELVGVSDFRRDIQLKRLSRCQLRDPYFLPDG